MLRRLYIEFPDRLHAATAVEELIDLGVVERHIHTIAAEGVDVSGLPVATSSQRRNQAARIESLGWNLNLGIFFVAAILLVVSLFQQLWFMGTVMALVMVTTFTLGNYFATHIPHHNMQQFIESLKHGDILLMVDIPLWQVPATEKVLRKHHPEMLTGGVSWAVESWQV